LGKKPRQKTFWQKLLYALSNEWADDAKIDAQVERLAAMYEQGRFDAKMETQARKGYEGE
jgi:hypothetical protein